MKMELKSVILFFCVFSRTQGDHHSSLTNTILGLNIAATREDRDQYISQHRVSGYWWISSTLNVIGTIVNGFVLYVFIQERKNILFGVNATIWSVGEANKKN